MSMYSKSSAHYWNSRKKSHSYDKRKIAVLVALGILFCLMVTFGRYKKSKVHERKLKLKPSITLDQIKTCNIYFKNNQNQCLSICLEERRKSPRPTFHQSCMYGCNTAFSLSTEIGCQTWHDDNETILDIIRKSYERCNKYQNTVPRPDIFSTCRKYYKIGAERGFHESKSFISNFVDRKWKQMMT